MIRLNQKNYVSLRYIVFSNIWYNNLQLIFSLSHIRDDLQLLSVIY